MSRYNRDNLSRDGENEFIEIDVAENATPVSDTQTTTTDTIWTPSKRKNRRNFVIFMIFLGLDIALLIFIIWQLVSIFSSSS